MKIVTALHTAGITTLTFAGGDPSLRRDLPVLTSHALTLGLKVEVQTNAQYVSKDFRSVLERSDVVGLSLDGPTPHSHDKTRKTRGNFNRVLSLLDDLIANGTPVMVKTVITRENHHVVPAIAEVLNKFASGLRYWSLLEFSPVNEGFENKDRYSLPGEIFDEAVEAATQRFSAPDKIVGYRTGEKIGTYIMVASDGSIYGITEEGFAESGAHRMCGSLLVDHLSDIAHATPFSKQKHDARFPLALIS